MRDSASSLGLKYEDHILAENGTRPQEDQHSVLDPNGDITYSLRMGQGGERVSIQSRIQIARSHTN